MATAAAIAAAAIGAAGSIGGSMIASRGAAAAAGRAGRVTKVPMAPYETAIAHYAARTAAANENATPPSFGDYIQSGGTAKYPFTDPGLTPLEAIQLRLVDKTGGKVPFFDKSQTELTPEQKLYEGAHRYWNARQNGIDINMPDWGGLIKMYADAHGLPRPWEKNAGDNFFSSGKFENILSGGQGDSFRKWFQTGKPPGSTGHKKGG